MVLRQVLHLDQASGVSPGAVGPIKLDQPSGPVVSADYGLHSRVFLHARLGQLLPQRERELHLAAGRFQQVKDGCLRERVHRDALFCQPCFELRRGVGVVQPGDGLCHLHVSLLELLVTGDGLLHQREVQPDAPVVDLLVQHIVAPLGFRHGELGETLLDGHFRLHVTEVIRLEERPLLRGVCRIMPERVAIPRFGGGTEITDQVLALFELLFLQPQHRADAFQRQRQAEGRRPHHRAMPRGGVQISACRVP